MHWIAEGQSHSIRRQNTELHLVKRKEFDWAESYQLCTPMRATVMADFDSYVINNYTCIITLG